MDFWFWVRTLPLRTGPALRLRPHYPDSVLPFPHTRPYPFTHLYTLPPDGRQLSYRPAPHLPTVLRVLHRAVLPHCYGLPLDYWMRLPHRIPTYHRQFVYALYATPLRIRCAHTHYMPTTYTFAPLAFMPPRFTLPHACVPFFYLAPPPPTAHAYHATYLISAARATTRVHRRV